MTVILTITILVLIAVLTCKRWMWRHYANELRRDLVLTVRRQGDLVNFDKLSELPEPVRKYFRLVLSDGAPVIDKATVIQEGGFRTRQQTDSWMPMWAQQQFSAYKRGFLWRASIKTAPLLKIDVIDSYIHGRARMTGKLASLITVIDARDSEELRQAALQRYLAEAVWFPTSLLPVQGVTWTAVDSTRARATIRDSDVTAALEFEFNGDGLVTGVFTEARYRHVNGRYELCPWRGKFGNYINVGRCSIPSQAEVAWLLNDQEFSYWRAKITDVQYH